MFQSSVATALTVYGIETMHFCTPQSRLITQLQQHLPFTVLKPGENLRAKIVDFKTVATALTVYGIETSMPLNPLNLADLPLQQHLPFTVLKLSKSCLL